MFKRAKKTRERFRLTSNAFCCPFTLQFHNHMRKKYLIICERHFLYFMSYNKMYRCPTLENKR